MTATALEANCTLLLHNEDVGSIKESDLMRDLENKDEKIKIKALKNIILSTLNGHPLPKLLMHIIKFTLHSESHQIKKLCMMYWEVVEKRGKDGKLLHEMILVCNALKNNLEHPNEFIQGSTLRFLCRIKEADIMESGLVPSIHACLEHRHSYVRKNAILCLSHVYENFPDLIPDAPEIVEKFLYAENNPGAKRNAFLMLMNSAQDRAINYLASIADDISSQSSSFQLLTLDLIRKACRANPLVKSQYIQCIFTLVNSPDHAVAFEGANTLVSLSAAPTAVRAAVSAYCQLLMSVADNNVKLVVLNRLESLKKRNEKILQEMLMDILRILSSPNFDIRKKALELALDLVTPRNVDDVVGLLKKEIQKTPSTPVNKGENYRKLLIDTMHKCAVKFPEVVQTVVHLLMQYVGDENASSALDVLYFVREIVDEYPQLRDGILNNLIENFGEIRASQVFRVCLWILGEYAVEPAVLDLALDTIRENVGELPLLSVKKVEEVEESKVEDPDTLIKKKGPSGPVVLADGTYAMTSAHVKESAVAGGADDASHSHLRSQLLGGDFFLASTLGVCMTKLSLRFASINGHGTVETNQQSAQSMLLLVSCLRLGQQSEKTIDSDSKRRLQMCIQILMDPAKYSEAFMADSRDAFSAMLRAQRAKKSDQDASDPLEVLAQADDLIVVRQLKNKLMDDFLDDGDEDLSLAMGSKSAKELSKLNRAYQLTGFADPVYAEAQLTVLEYDIVLEILVVNQTDSVQQNLVLELNTSGDLKVVERPSPITLGPRSSQKLNASIKVTSTDSGIIFGNIVYDDASGTNQTVVVLNNIHMDIMDYIRPAFTTDTKFRAMWAEFEWENKVAVNTDIAELSEYLDHILKITNMNCMTPQATMSGSCQFLAANLYARSIFGEDALLNLSVELQQNGKVGGFIRIRSKTQGIALSLGDKITARQRKSKSQQRIG